MNPLANLRDIHIPPFVGFWPIAIGWYVLLLTLLLMGIGIAWRWRLRQRRLQPRREALARLQQLQARYQHDQDAVAIAIELSMLLRRSALAAFPTVKVASLREEAWLSFLDQVGQTSEFSQGVGRTLISAPYQRSANYPVEALFALIGQWIEANVGQKRHRSYVTD